jgi:hypothetical protein
MRCASALLLLLGTELSTVRADGCKFSITGHPVPEHEQRAFIEWADGVETLHVATLSDPSSEGSVWIVPIRAPASAIRAEPVEEIPAVVFYVTLKSHAIGRLRDWIDAVGMLDSGGLACPFFFAGCGSNMIGHPEEASRIEKSGMVVTVVSAESRTKLENYLNGQGVSWAAADLSALQPYFANKDFAFVCGWIARRDKPVTATGMRIAFPSPTLWFPLQATRANPASVSTVVFVRGFVKPVDGCQLPGLRCDYIYGDIELKGVNRSSGPDPSSNRWNDFHSVQVTRITLTTDPQKWDRDLELTPGTTSVGTVCLNLIKWGEPTAWILSSLLGAMLGLLIPWTMIAKADRQWKDRLAGAAIGGAILLSILASFVVFSAWRWQRFSVEQKQPRRWHVLPVLAVAHFAIVYAVCKGLIMWIERTV